MYMEKCNERKMQLKTLKSQLHQARLIAQSRAARHLCSAMYDTWFLTTIFNKQYLY